MSLSITSTCVGGRHASPAMRTEQPKPRASRKQVNENPFGLTGRECQVIEALIKYPTQLVVAERLFIDLSTVEKHIQHAKAKAEVASVVQLVLAYDRATRD